MMPLVFSKKILPLTLFLLVGLLMLASCLEPFSERRESNQSIPAVEPSPSVEITISSPVAECPTSGQQIEVTIRIIPHEDRIAATLATTLSKSLVFVEGDLGWQGDLRAEQVVEVQAILQFVGNGPVRVTADLTIGEGSKYSAFWSLCEPEPISAPSLPGEQETHPSAGIDSSLQSTATVLIVEKEGHFQTVESTPGFDLALVATPERPDVGETIFFTATVLANQDTEYAKISVVLPLGFQTDQDLPVWEGAFLQGEQINLVFSAVPEKTPSGVAEIVVQTVTGEYRAGVTFGEGVGQVLGAVLPSCKPAISSTPDVSVVSELVDWQLQEATVRSDYPPADLTIVTRPERPLPGETFTLSVFVLANQSLSDVQIPVELSPNLSVITGTLSPEYDAIESDSVVLVELFLRREDANPAQVSTKLIAANGVQVESSRWFGPPEVNDLGQSENGAVEVTAAGTLYLSGRFVYDENLSTRRGVYYARVEVFDDDGVGDDFICRATTDSNGYWSCSGTASDPFDNTVEVYARIHAYNSWYGSVRDSSNNEYRAVTDNFDASEDGQTLNLGTWAPPDPPGVSYAWDGAYHILKMLIYANELTDTQGGEKPPYDGQDHFIRAIWPDTDSDNTSEYGNWTVYIEGPGSTDSDEWDESVVLHEYGHYIMDHFADLGPPYVDYGADGAHTWCSHENRETAYIEGWADYYQSAVKRFWGMANPERYEETTWWESLETDWHSTTGTWDDTECSIAGILWDINDSANDDQNGDSIGDTLGLEHNEIHGVFSFYDPSGSRNHPWDIHDFWNGWHAREGWHQEVWAVFYEHGINKDTLSPGTPTLYTPNSGSTIADNTPAFDWSSISDNGYSGLNYYQIQVDNNSSFASPEINQTPTASNYTPGTALANGRWYWKVRARDRAGNWGAWSVTWYFDLCAMPATAFLSSPSDGSSTCDTTPTFSWGSVSGATAYRIQVDNNSDFSSPVINQTTSSTSYTPGANLSAGAYYWRVQASNACGGVLWSLSRRLVVANCNKHVYLPMVLRNR